MRSEKEERRRGEMGCNEGREEGNERESRGQKGRADEPPVVQIPYTPFTR